MSKETIEKIWAIYFVLSITVMCFGAGYIHITNTEKFNTETLNWILSCFLFIIPPNILFFVILTMFKK